MNKNKRLNKRIRDFYNDGALGMAIAETSIQLQSEIKIIRKKWHIKPKHDFNKQYQRFNKNLTSSKRNQLKQAVLSISRKHHVSSSTEISYQRWLQYIFTNSFFSSQYYGIPYPEFRISPITKELELWVRVWPTTNADDIKEAWSMIESYQANLKGCIKRTKLPEILKGQTKYNMAVLASSFRELGLTYKGIAEVFGLGIETEIQNFIRQLWNDVLIGLKNIILKAKKDVAYKKKISHHFLGVTDKTMKNKIKEEVKKKIKTYHNIRKNINIISYKEIERLVRQYRRTQKYSLYRSCQHPMP